MSCASEEYLMALKAGDPVVIGFPRYSMAPTDARAGTVSRVTETLIIVTIPGFSEHRFRRVSGQLIGRRGYHPEPFIMGSDEGAKTLAETEIRAKLQALLTRTEQAVRIHEAKPAFLAKAQELLAEIVALQYSLQVVDVTEANDGEEGHEHHA